LFEGGGKRWEWGRWVLSVGEGVESIRAVTGGLHTLTHVLHQGGVYFWSSTEEI